MYVGLKQPRGDGERYVTPARAAAKETSVVRAWLLSSNTAVEIRRNSANIDHPGLQVSGSYTVGYSFITSRAMFLYCMTRSFSVAFQGTSVVRTYPTLAPVHNSIDVIVFRFLA